MSCLVWNGWLYSRWALREDRVWKRSCSPHRGQRKGSWGGAPAPHAWPFFTNSAVLRVHTFCCMTPNNKKYYIFSIPVLGYKNTVSQRYPNQGSQAKVDDLWFAPPQHKRGKTSCLSISSSFIFLLYLFSFLLWNIENIKGFDF